MTLRPILHETALLIAISAVTAFCVNAVSPYGIALVGQWNPERGAVTAHPRGEGNFHELEIRNPESARRIYDRGSGVFVDARPLSFFEAGHIKGAVSLPLRDAGALMASFKTRFAPDTYLVIYCSGRECDDSHQLAQLLLENGYSDVSIFIDGYPGWLAKGYPVENDF